MPNLNHPEYASFLQKAHADGYIRVIVGLNVAYRLEGNIANIQSIQAQRQNIQQAQQDLLTDLAAYDMQIMATYKTVPYLALRVDEVALQRLILSPQVAVIEEDIEMFTSLESSLPVIGVPPAWDMGYTGAGQTIAILDTGVDKYHPFLANKVILEACFSNPGGEPGRSSLCPNGQPSQIGPDTALPYECPGLEGCEHGTHVAGIAAGNGGVAKDSKIIAVQVFHKVEDTEFCFQHFRTNSCEVTSYSDQILALEQIYEWNNQYPKASIAAVNLSLRSDEVFSDFCDM